MKVERLSNPLDSRAFLSIAQFLLTKERLCMNLVSVVVEYTLQVARIQFPTQAYNSQYSAVGTAGSVMTIGLSINGCSHSKISLTRENKID